MLIAGASAATGHAWMLVAGAALTLAVAIIQ
jgi:hypothetical protein